MNGMKINFIMNDRGVCVCVCGQSSRIISIAAWWVFEDPTGLPELLLLGDCRWWLIKFLNGLKSVLYVA